jgi:hypothetical protein
MKCRQQLDETVRVPACDEHFAGGADFLNAATFLEGSCGSGIVKLEWEFEYRRMCTYNHISYNIENYSRHISELPCK